MPKKKAKTKPSTEPYSLNITVDQLNDGIRRQYGYAANELKTDEDLRNLVREFGVDPDELAKDIEKDIP